MKFTTERPYADPEIAACKLIDIANSVEAEQDGRIHIELINGPFLYESRAARRSMAQVSISQSSAAGWRCTKAAPM